MKDDTTKQNTSVALQQAIEPKLYYVEMINIS